MLDITLWIIFVCFKYIWLTLDLKQLIILKNFTNIENFEHMKYICNIIIFMTKFQNLRMYFKTKIVGGIFGWIFFGWMILIIITKCVLICSKSH
jgi:hypothetical protein